MNTSSTFCSRSSSVLRDWDESSFILQEALGRDRGQSQYETELNALRERVKTLSTEKTALEGKLKKLSQSKKG